MVLYRLLVIGINCWSKLSYLFSTTHVPDEFSPINEIAGTSSKNENVKIQPRNDKADKTIL